ncbi:sensor histidine kinase, partial [Rhodospirillum rubrum]
PMPSLTPASTKVTAPLLLAAFAGLALLLFATVWLGNRTQIYATSFDQTQEIYMRATRTFRGLQDAETGQRGYLLTHDPAYLQPYHDALSRMSEQRRLMNALIQDTPWESGLGAKLTPLIDAKLAELARTVDLAQAGRWDEALALVLAGSGKTTMDQARTVLEDTLAELRSALQTQSEEMKTRSAYLFWAVTFGGLFILCVAGTAFWLIVRANSSLAQAQAQLRSLNESLESRVRGRTQEVQRANEEIQRFAYIVSHDLRSPLVNVMGFTAELEAGLKDLQARHPIETGDGALSEDERDLRVTIFEDMPEAVGFIRSSTAKMDGLINAILRLSREGRRTISPERLDMTALVESVVSTTTHSIQDTGSTVSVDKNLPEIVSDRLALSQIFANLIDNAIKYRLPGRPCAVTITGRIDRGRALFQVADTGRGIEPKDHERIFDLFRRSGEQDQPGEGIGLAHVRTLVRRLGGEITVGSVPGQGTTFHITLPFDVGPYLEIEPS